MGALGNLLRKVSYKVSGGILGTADGQKPGTTTNPVVVPPVNNTGSLNLFDKIFGDVSHKASLSAGTLIGLGLIVGLFVFLFKKNSSSSKKS